MGWPWGEGQLEEGAGTEPASYPFSRVTHLASRTRSSWRSWKTLELKIKSRQSFRHGPRAKTFSSSYVRTEGGGGGKY